MGTSFATMIKSIIEGENNLTKEILNKVRKEGEENKWNKQITEYLKETNIKYNEIYKLKRKEIKKKVRKWDNDMWKKKKKKKKKKKGKKIWEKKKKKKKKKS